MGVPSPHLEEKPLPASHPPSPQRGCTPNVPSVEEAGGSASPRPESHAPQARELVHGEVRTEPAVTPMGTTVRPANPQGSVSPSPTKAPTQGEQHRERGRAPTSAAVCRPCSRRRRCRFTWGSWRGCAERGTAS